MESKENIDTADTLMEETTVEGPKAERQKPKKPLKKGGVGLVFILLIVIYMVFKLSVAGTTEQAVEAPPALVPVMGGLESLFPDLPAGLNFGDSEATVIEKMGRQADGRIDAAENIYMLSFKAPDLHGFQAAYLMFLFGNGILESVIIRFEYTIKNEEDQKNLDQVTIDYFDKLLPLIGEPTIKGPKKIEKFGITLLGEWELQDNILLLASDSTNRDDFFVLTTSLRRATLIGPII